MNRPDALRRIRPFVYQVELSEEYKINRQTDCGQKRKRHRDVNRFEVLESGN